MYRVFRLTGWMCVLLALLALIIPVSARRMYGEARYVNVAVEESDLYPQLYTTPAGDFIRPAQPTVYFTFDDGPSQNTAAILDVLKEEEVKATFFVSAQEREKPHTAPLLRRILEEGHTLGLHTYSHQYRQIYRSVEDYLKDLDAINSYIQEETGYTPQILRFPGGSTTRNADEKVMQAIVDEVTRRGYLFYDWTVVSGDDTPTVLSPEHLAKNIVEGAKGQHQAVILAHDGVVPTTTAQAVKLSIGQLRQQGYAFDRLTPQVEPIQRRPPKK